jgi:hypothetical protein
MIADGFAMLGPDGEISGFPTVHLLREPATTLACYPECCRCKLSLELRIEEATISAIAGAGFLKAPQWAAQPTRQPKSHLHYRQLRVMLMAKASGPPIAAPTKPYTVAAMNAPSTLELVSRP